MPPLEDKHTLELSGLLGGFFCFPALEGCSTRDEVHGLCLKSNASPSETTTSSSHGQEAAPPVRPVVCVCAQYGAVETQVCVSRGWG